MKKLFLFFTSSLLFLVIVLSFPTASLAAELGGKCSTPNKFDGCQLENRVVYCQCLNGTWQYYSEIETAAEIYNPALKEFGIGSGETIIAQVIANALKIVFSISGLILLVMLLIGGFQWMTAGGNKEALANAQKRISSALIGFVIFISVFAIINFVAPVLGLEFLQILKIEWPTP